MEHMRAIAIKFISSLVLLYVILGLFYGMTFGSVFFISLVLGLASYVLGDLFILPRTSNMVATATDFALAFVVIWMMSRNMLFRDNFLMMTLIASIGVATFEYFFHKYMLNNVFHSENKGGRTQHLQYQTELAEEISPGTEVIDDTKDERE